MDIDPSLKKKRISFDIQNLPRPSIISNFSVNSIISESEVTDENLEAWKALPDEVKRDPSLVNFRKRFEELHGVDPFENDYTGSKDSGFGFPKDVQFTEDTEDNEPATSPHASGHQQNKYVGYVKIFLLISCWVMFTFFLMRNDEKEFHFRHLSISEGKIRSYALHDIPTNARIKLIFEGVFLTEYKNDQADEFLYYYLSLDSPNGQSRNISELYRLGIETHNELDHVEMSERTNTIFLEESDFNIIKDNTSMLVLNLYTHLTDSFPASVAYDPSPLNKDAGIILAAIVLIGLYVLIVFELVHRTIAAMIAAAMALGILAVMNERPTMEDIILWIDAETLLLLFGMMILVAILAQTGLFDYLAVYAFKITKGRIWPLIICLCVFTAVLSSVLDNVTTILLMTPVTIRLCEVMELNPIPVLLFSVIYSNIGGTLTPVGDPPNVIITSNRFISSSGVTFLNFTMHMAIPVILAMVVGYFQLRLMYRDIKKLKSKDPRDIRELKHEIKVWEEAASTLSSSRDEDILRRTLQRKVRRLNRKLLKKADSPVEVPIETYEATLAELQAKYAIKDKPLLWKSCVVLTIVIAFFFLHSFPEIQKLSLGWTALLGAILLLVLYDSEDLDAILHHVEWSTLLFFAALFILMEALSELGLIQFIGEQTESVILSVGEDARLAVAILIILWVSALASAFVDNIPLTTMMIKIVIDLSENEALELPLQPLVWSLALGACLGGNGTLIGASANVVCAGVAEQYGYKLTFNQFFKVGFPIMMGSIIVATAYLMIAHVALAWH